MEVEVSFFRASPHSDFFTSRSLGDDGSSWTPEPPSLSLVLPGWWREDSPSPSFSSGVQQEHSISSPPPLLYCRVFKPHCFLLLGGCCCCLFFVVVCFNRRLCEIRGQAVFLPYFRHMNFSLEKGAGRRGVPGASVSPLFSGNWWRRVALLIPISPFFISETGWSIYWPHPLQGS